MLVCASVNVFLHSSAAKEGAWVGLKPDLQGGTRVLWTPMQRKRVFKRGQKFSRLKSKVVPPGGSSFQQMANLLMRLYQVEAELTSNS